MVAASVRQVSLVNQGFHRKVMYEVCGLFEGAMQIVLALNCTIPWDRCGVRRDDCPRVNTGSGSKGVLHRVSYI